MTDSDGFYWTPTPYLQFVDGALHQWWQGMRELSYGEVAHGPTTTSMKGEWRKVKTGELIHAPYGI